MPCLCRSIVQSLTNASAASHPSGRGDGAGARRPAYFRQLSHQPPASLARPYGSPDFVFARPNGSRRSQDRRLRHVFRPFIDAGRRVRDFLFHHRFRGSPHQLELTAAAMNEYPKLGRANQLPDGRNWVFPRRRWTRRGSRCCSTSGGQSSADALGTANTSRARKLMRRQLKDP